MRKIKCAILFIAACMVLAGCACEHVYDDGVVTKKPTCSTAGEKTYTCRKCKETTIETIPMVAHNYEEETVKEPTYVEKGLKKYTCSLCGDNYTEEIPVREAEVIVTVTEKESIPKDTSKWIFSDYVRLTVEIQNLTNRSIKGIQGVLIVKDMFGEEFLRSQCDLADNEIPAKGTITVTELYLDINQFFKNQIKLFETDYDNLQFDYDVTNIVFTN